MPFCGFPSITGLIDPYKAVAPVYCLIFSLDPLRRCCSIVKAYAFVEGFDGDRLKNKLEEFLIGGKYEPSGEARLVL